MKFTKDKLQQILDNHKHWLKRDVKNWRIMRADFSGLDLKGINLKDIDLRGAIFYETDLRGAHLVGANLKCADFYKSNLGNADLYLANISDAKLVDTNLYHAFLYKANLSQTFFSEVNLGTADLHCANLYGANLSNTDLSGADLRETNLYCADLSTAKNVPFIPSICPETGSFIGYKKAGGYIVELEITSDAKRSSATTRKCRCSKAKVLSLQFPNGTKSDRTQIRSDFSPSFIYKVGEIVEVKDFDENRWNECAPGIHFFINRQEAVDY